MKCCYNVNYLLGHTCWLLYHSAVLQTGTLEHVLAYAHYKRSVDSLQAYK